MKEEKIMNQKEKNKFLEDFFNKVMDIAGDSSSDYCRLAESSIKYLKDEKRAIEIYHKALDLAENSSDYNTIAVSVIELLKDKNYAMSIYKKAEKCVEDIVDYDEVAQFVEIAEAVINNLKDEKWGRELYLKALAQTAYNYAPCRCACEIADSIIKHLGDKEWAKTIYEKAYKNRYNYDSYEFLIHSIINSLEDDDWACDIYEEALEDALKREISFGDFCSLTDETIERFKKINFKQKIYNKFFENTKYRNVFCFLGDVFINHFEDSKIACEAYKMQEEISKTSISFSELAVSVTDYLKDYTWGEKLFNKSYQKAEVFGEFILLSNALIQYPEYKELALKSYQRAEKKALKCEDLCCLVDFAVEHLKDKNRGRKLLDQALIKAETYNDYDIIFDHILYNFKDESWATTVYKKGLNTIKNYKDFVAIELAILSGGYVGKELKYSILKKAYPFYYIMNFIQSHIGLFMNILLMLSIFLIIPCLILPPVYQKISQHYGRIPAWWETITVLIGGVILWNVIITFIILTIAKYYKKKKKNDNK